MAAAERIVATVLGCGSSGGVPRVGNVWGLCDETNSRNRRRRCALLVEGFSAGQAEPTRIIIDTGCDLREQLLDARVGRVDAVFYTHEHADHTHGIDDLRVLALNTMKRVDVYYSEATGRHLNAAFSYCFVAPPGSGYPPILNGHVIAPGMRIEVEGPGGAIGVMPFEQLHGEINSLGYRIGGFAYSCDLNGIPEHSLAAVSGLDVWIIDALRPTPHPSHLSLPESLELIGQMQPRQVVLTNLHIDMDYETVERTTPGNVTPAYDGMRIDVSAGKVMG